MDSPATSGTSVIRRTRAMAMMARLANQPYPIITQRTKAWVEGLDNAPQQTANVASAADYMDEEDYSEQSALTEHLLSERYAATFGGAGRNLWYCETVASSMHTASMYDETVKKDDARPLSSMYDWEDDVVDGVVQKKPGTEDGEHDGGSVDVPSSRSITPPPKVSRRKGKKRATRRAVLDEDYDGETARPVTVGRVSFADDTIYLPSNTAVEATSSPHGSPPPQRKRRKAAKSARGSWRTSINRGSRGDGASGFA